MATSNVSNARVSQVSVVVWEWMTEFGRWRPYEPDLVRYIEQYYGKTSQIYPGSVHPALAMYIIDFNSMCQIRQGSGTARPIRRNICPIICSNGNQIVWQFSGDITGNWDMYDFEVGNFLETSYNNGQHMINMSTSPFHLPYNINLKKMEQVRIQTGTVRGMRRHTLPTPYPLAASNLAMSYGTPTNFSSYASQNPASVSVVKRQMQASNSSSSDSDESSKMSTMTRKKIKTSAKTSKRTKSGYSNQFPAVSSSLTSHAPGQGTGMFSHSSNPSNNFVSNQLTSTIQNMSLNIPSSVGISSSFQGPITRGMYNNYASGLPMMQNMQNTFVQQNTFPTSHASQNMVSNSLSSHNMQGFMPMTQAMPNPISSLSNSVFMPQASMSFPLSVPFPSLPGGIPNPYIPATQPSLSSMPNVGKSHSRSLKPVVSNVANPLVSPSVPVPQVPIFSPPGLSSRSFQPMEGLPQSGRIVLSKPRKTKSKSADEVLKKYVKSVPHPKEDEDCCICYDKLEEESSYGNEHSHNERVVRFKRCDHTFHRQCLYAMYDSGHKDDSIQCPSCKAIYGERYGVCPPGDMEFHLIPHSLPGYPDNHTIRVSYNIRSGIQGTEHPNPGSRYNARGFPRVGYLPDSDQGRKVLHLLIIAWKRRLMFTIGTSTTTGESDTVTWNEIHHKTEFGSNVTGHGYPDPSYLNNVMLELAVHGVTEDDL